MGNISFLGGSGYICSSIKKYNFKAVDDINFYSRRKSEKCIQYKDISELPSSEILFDLSQWANGHDIEKLGLDEMKNLVKKTIAKSHKYIFISTLSIDINKKLNYSSDNYSSAKLNFEKMVLEHDNTYVLRIPSCFNKNPKLGSLINLMFSRLNGSNEVIKAPMKYTSGITTLELFKFFQILIKKTDRISELFGENRILRIGDGYAYKISKLEEFLKIELNKKNLINDKFVYPDEYKVSLINDNNWYLQPVCFPIKMLNTFEETLSL